MNDFNCLMNNEYPVIFEPRYMLINKNGKWDKREFTNKELEELDLLAELMRKPKENFERLQHIWKREIKFKKLLGISSWN